MDKEFLYVGIKNANDTTIFDEIEIDNLPICGPCLTEVKYGNYICSECKINMCDSHKDEHRRFNDKHIIKKLIKKE